MTIRDKPDFVAYIKQDGRKMAATRFTPDAFNSQKRRSGRVVLLQHHKTDPSQHHDNRRYNFNHTKGCATNGWAV